MFSDTETGPAKTAAILEEAEAQKDVEEACRLWVQAMRNKK